MTNLTTLSSSLIVIASLFCSTSVHLNKQLKPLQTEVVLKGFRVSGGVVNLIEGDVTCECGATTEELVKTKQTLHNGNTLQVGINGRAEVLLNPGYYLRLDANTRVTLLDLSRNNLKLKILSGSAVVEVLVNQFLEQNIFPKETKIRFYEPITIVTPREEYAISDGGVYRFDISADGSSQLKVPRGVAFAAGTRIANGKMISFRNGVASVMKYDKISGDVFDRWSRDRASTLIALNKSLKHTPWYKQLNANPQSYMTIMDEDVKDMVREEFTVSALGGVVSHVENNVTYMRTKSNWEILKKGDVLQYGDHIETGNDSRAEILLYPTCSLHLSNNTQIAYLGNAGGLTVRLVRGAAIVTAAENPTNQTTLTFAAPRANFEIVQRGIYRFNVVPDGRSEILVYEGKINAGGREIKKGNKAISNEAELVVYPVSKQQHDSFDVWSRKRTSTIFQPGPMTRWTRWYLSQIRIGRARYSGMWYLHGTSDEYTFIPGEWDFSSPYGGGYTTKFRTDSLPRANY